MAVANANSHWLSHRVSKPVSQAQTGVETKSCVVSSATICSWIWARQEQEKTLHRHRQVLEPRIQPQGTGTAWAASSDTYSITGLNVTTGAGVSLSITGIGVALGTPGVALLLGVGLVFGVVSSAVGCSW